VELSAHTDSRGSSKDNLNLSQKRAQSCVDYLIQKGVPKANIVAKGYGEGKLVNKCSDGVECTEEEHQANRRTEIKVLKVN
jgi:outer membrane protein OmpA-like peptidoglycan-associated protein